MDTILLCVTVWAAFNEALYISHTGESFDVQRTLELVDYVICTDEFQRLKEKLIGGNENEGNACI